MAETSTPEAMSLTELAVEVSGSSIDGETTTPVRDIVYDSRDVTSGALFVALRGADHDGHAFLADAARLGASAAMVDSDWTAPAPDGLALLRVADTRAALAPVSATFFRHPSRDLRVVGITGTDGKTTTSYMVDHLLTQAGLVTGMTGTVAVRIAGVEDRHALRQTTQESVENQRLLRRMVDAKCDVAIMESTSHGLDLHRLDDIAFAVGAVTNITHEHLEHHKTIQAYWRAKAILFERLGPDGVAIVNVDDLGARSVLPFVAPARLIRYSRLDGSKADLYVDNLTLGNRGSRFDLRWHGEAIEVALPQVGGFNVDNALCAAGIALGLGVPLSTVAKGLSSAPAPPGRMVHVDEGQPFSVLVDYAHTPESLTKVLLLLRSLRPEGRLIVVFGSAGDRDPTKRPIQGEAAGKHADQVILTNEDPRTEDPHAILEAIARGARLAGRRDGTDLHLIADRRSAIATAIASARAGDTILLAGKGHEGSIIVGHHKLPWDEEQVAREELRAAGFGGNSSH